MALWVLFGPGTFALAARSEIAPAAPEGLARVSLGDWLLAGRPARAVRVDSAAEEITLRLAQGAAPGEGFAQGPSIPSFESQTSDTPPAVDPLLTPPAAPTPALPLPPEATSPGQPSPAAKACLFAAASTLPLVPDAKITSASAAPMGSMAGDDMYRDFRVILIVDALAMTTTVEFICRSADTPEIFGAEILSARILE